MKNYRTALASLVLTFVFCTSAFADGVIHTEKTPPPPPPPLQADSIMYTGIATPAPETDDVTEIALSLLQNLLNLL
jgi:hypothetical protein